MNLLKKRKKIFKDLLSILTYADKILIIILFFISFVFFYIIHNSNSKKSILVYYHGKLIGKYSNTVKDKLIKIDNGIEIEISRGKARVLHSTCKKKYCVKQGWSNSLPIICVPNKLIIKFKNNKSKKIILTK